jgi:hypothetical protein
MKITNNIESNRWPAKFLENILAFVQKLNTNETDSHQSLLVLHL